MNVVDLNMILIIISGTFNNQIIVQSQQSNHLYLSNISDLTMWNILEFVSIEIKDTEE